MAYQSESEGEIVESDGEKATTTQHSVNGTSVNRKLREALSPSPVHSPYSPSQSAHSRDRSRSPYRASRSPRGEKRAREEDHHGEKHIHDSRLSKARYDESKARGEINRGSKNSRESRQGHLRGPSGRYDERDGRSRYRDQRNRSPRGFGWHEERYNRHDRNTRERSPTGRKPEDRFYHRRLGENHRLQPDEQSVSDHNTGISSNSRRANRDTEHNAALPKQDFATGSSNKKLERDTTDTTTNVDSMAQYGEVSLEAPSAETVSLEERRRRREEIKAKYKSQATPMLAQALQLDATPGNSPSHTRTSSQKSDDAGSPPPDSPVTPQLDSANDSPIGFAVADDADLANSNTAVARNAEVDEPSAADYDPTMDMQEDRMRKDQREQGDAVHEDQPVETEFSHEPAAAANLVEEEKQIPQRTKPAPRDDMFASDDEDDMFAPITTSAADSKQLRDVPTVKAKELDRSLLDNWDDPAGYYRIILEELLDGRYQVKANLGKGMFSSVVRAVDTTTGNLVAIKIIRNNESMVKAGTREMEILQKLADADPDDKKHLIRLNRSFYHKDHLCMVFENLSINLREVLKKFGRDVGINMRAVRSYAQQMFLGLSLLRKCNILHADLKPDNILVNESRNLLKICDLGSAAEAPESDITPYLVSRFYRAPEIILGIPYDFAIDMWSVGCTLFELATGKILFTGRTNNQMLRSVMECRGKFSLKMLKKAEFGQVHFDDQYVNFRSFERDDKTGKDVTRLINFVKPTRDLKTRLLNAAGSGNKPGARVLPEAELKEINLFADLLEKCLALNPEKRITPTEALKHSFVHRAGGVPTKG